MLLVARLVLSELLGDLEKATYRPP
jgi:hypothetical protein